MFKINPNLLKPQEDINSNAGSDMMMAAPGRETMK
jgi:hypothetical protein